MAAVDDEVRAALAARAELLLRVANECLWLVFQRAKTEEDLHSLADLRRFEEMIAMIREAEGLTAETLHTCGASWAILGAWRGTSGQAMQKSELRAIGAARYAEAAQASPRQRRLPEIAGYVEDMAQGAKAQVVDQVRIMADALLAVRKKRAWWKRPEP